jgi:tetratricopeptide (TPR) repeat protein
MADIYYATGQLNAAAEALDMALRMEETSKVDDRVYPRLLSLSIHAQRGNLPQARKALAEMSDLVDDHKKANVGLLHWAEARLACFEARWEEAAAKYQMGIDIARQIGMSWFATYVQMELGEALLSRVSAQDQAAGREHLQQALESFKLIQAMGYVAQLQSRLQETDIIASGSR